MNEKLIDELRRAEEVEALVLGGSRATGKFDDNSDYDYYVYLTKEFPEAKRRKIFSKYVSYMEYSNKFWELEDDGTLINGIDVEFIFRNLDDIDKTMENTLLKGQVSHGYSSCFVDNLFKSKIIFDKNGKVQELKEKYKEAINTDFFMKIIKYNYPILLDKMPSMYYQIEKAIKRNDLISVNHRVTAFFEIYFDIVFAINEATHPGEKRMLEYASNLDKTPNNMVNNINDLFKVMYDKKEEILIILEQLVVELHQLLKAEGHQFSFRSYN